MTACRAGVRWRRAIELSAAAVAIAALTVSTVACAPKSPDYQSIWTKSSTTSAPTTASAPLVPLSQYLESVGVAGAPVAPNTLTDLTVSIPTPPGWAPHHDPKATPNTEAISKGGEYPMAMLMVFKLRGDLNPAEAVIHANADAENRQGTQGDHDQPALAAAQSKHFDRHRRARALRRRLYHVPKSTEGGFRHD